MRLTMLSCLLASTLLSTAALAEPAAAPATTPAPSGMMGGGHGKPPVFMGPSADADVNHDGALSREEFLVSAEKRFKEMDANGDGKVTPDEMKAFHQKMMQKMSSMPPAPGMAPATGAAPATGTAPAAGMAPAKH